MIEINNPRDPLLCCLVTFVLLSALLSLSDATWNLFMNKTETNRLLGIHEDVYYVRNGTVNEYALTFNLPLKGHVKDIYFDWNSVMEKQELLYRMTLSTSNPSAIEVPLLSVASSGRIPTRQSTFSVHVPCSGFVSSEVDIRIQLNITSSLTSNTTIVELRRRKTCLMGESQLLVADLGGSNLASSTEEPFGHSSSTGMTLILIGSTFGLVLVAGVLTIVFYNTRKTSRPLGYHLSQSNCTRITTKDKNGNKSTSASCTRSLLSAGSPLRPLSPVTALIPRAMVSGLGPLVPIKPSQISLRRLIMEGSIGRLYYGILLSDNGEFTQSVLVKTVNAEIQDSDFDSFLSSVHSLNGCSHMNIQAMLDCIMEPSLGQPLVVYRFNNDCNLKIYLRTCRASQVLSDLQLLQMTLGICDGLSYLHRRSIVHKDIATRNCLVDDSLTVRVTDCALSSDFFPEDYYVSPVNGQTIPVRWLPIETLETGVYDMASEVWSFGVTAWEVLTFGQQPYPETGSSEVLTQLRSGHRLSLSNSCSEEMYQVLMECWSAQPMSRPTLTYLFGSIGRIYADLGQFV